MGVRNYLIEGISGTGKTSVCDELQRPGHHCIYGDRELAYQGDPRTSEPLDGFAHEHDIGDVDKVKPWWPTEVTRHRSCAAAPGISSVLIDLFDGVFVLEVDLDTLHRRPAVRPQDEWADGRANGNSLPDCRRRKKTFHGTRS
jgi:broad-specificity NMP kinase